MSLGRVHAYLTPHEAIAKYWLAKGLAGGITAGLALGISTGFDVVAAFAVGSAIGFGALLGLIGGVGGRLKCGGGYGGSFGVGIKPGTFATGTAGPIGFAVRIGLGVTTAPPEKAFGTLQDVRAFATLCICSASDAADLVFGDVELATPAGLYPTMLGGETSQFGCTMV